MRTLRSARPWCGVVLLVAGLGVSGCSSAPSTSQSAGEPSKVASSPTPAQTSTPRVKPSAGDKDPSNAESQATSTSGTQRSITSTPKNSKAATRPKSDSGQGGASDSGQRRHEPVVDAEGPGTGGPNQQVLLKSIAGPASSTCVTPGNSQRTIRSGSLAASDFVEAKNQFKAQSKGNKTAKVYLVFIPEQASKNQTLKVTAVSPQGKSKTVTSKNVGDANGWTYYGAQLPVAGPGSWTFKASVGSNTGCFQVRFG